MTQFHHQEYINKKLSKLSSEINTLRKDYDAIETHLNAVGGLIDALSYQECNLKKQQTKYECSELIEQLKTVKVWTLKKEILAHLSYKPLIKIIGIDCADRQVEISLKNRECVITYPCADIRLPFEYVESNLEPYTEKE